MKNEQCARVLPIGEKLLMAYKMAKAMYIAMQGIPMTLTASAQLMSQHLLFSAYRHDEYQRLSAEKAWQTPVGLMALSVHSTRQLGLHWRSAWHNLSLITDDNRLSHARDLQINLGVNFHWR